MEGRSQLSPFTDSVLLRLGSLQKEFFSNRLVKQGFKNPESSEL